MPESPISGSRGFSAPPPGKKALTSEELSDIVSDPLESAAKVLGGTAAATPGEFKVDKKPEEVEAEPFKVSQEDKQLYIRSLLGQEPFTKIYKLFGGVMKVVFRTRQSIEAQKILQIDDKKAKFKARFEISLLLIEVIINDGTTSELTLDKLDDIASSAVYASFKDFELLCDELFRKANDPDFWIGIAGLT